MKCQYEDCYNDAEFSVKMATVWGRYCENHVLEAIRSEFDTRVTVGEPINE